MDPVSVIGLVGSLVGISDVIGKTLGRLINLQSKFNKSSLTVSLLIGQLTTIKAALDQIAQLMKSSFTNEPQHEQLVLDLNVALDGCMLLIQVLEERISQFSRDGVQNGLDFNGKVGYLWAESDLNGFTSLLNNQTTALNLLLTALHCRTSFERDLFLRRDGSRRVIKRVEDNRTSLLSLKDSESFLTVSDNSDFLDADFEFDGEVITTAVYRAALRSNMRTAASKGRLPHPTTAKLEVSQPPITDIENQLEPSVREGLSPVDDYAVSRYKRPRAPSMYSAFKRWVQNDGDITQTVEVNLSSSQSAYAGSLLDRINSAQNSILSDTSSHHSDATIQLIGKQSSTPPKKTRLFRKGFQRRKSISKQISQAELDPVKTPLESPFSVSLFGSSNSGKSTIFNSIEALSNGGWSMKDRLQFKEVILSNTIQSMADVLRAMDKLGISKEFFQDFSNVQTTNARRIVDLSHMQVNRSEQFTKDILDTVDVLWSQSEVREAVARSAEYHLQDGAAYLFSSAKRFSDPDYVPNNEDILMTRIRTTGIHTLSLSFDDMEFKLTDTGGELPERRKWRHLFQTVRVIIFVVDISAYDKCLWEDGVTNRLADDLATFKRLCEKTTEELKCDKILLVFTKMDILEKKIQKVPIENWLAGFSGDNRNVDEVKEFIARRFINFANTNTDRKLMTLFTSIYSKDGLVDVGRIVLWKVRELLFGIEESAELTSSLDEIGEEIVEEEPNFF